MKKLIEAFDNLSVVYQGGSAATLITLSVIPFMYVIAYIGLFPTFEVAFGLYLIYCWIRLIINLFKK